MVQIATEHIRAGIVKNMIGIGARISIPIPIKTEMRL